jgi:hypothetical protein
MYIEIMFADKNNHLIKQILKNKRKGGDVLSNLEKPVVKTLPFTESKPVMEPTTIEVLPRQNEFPDTNYLYKNITSNKNINKANICAFCIQDTIFLKFIVETQGSAAVFPSFLFEATQKGGFLDDESSTSDLDKQFQQDAISFVKSFFKSDQDGGEPKPNVSMTFENNEEPKSSQQPDNVLLQEDNVSSKIDDEEEAIQSGQEDAIESGQEDAIQSGQEDAIESGQEDAIQSGQEDAIQSGQEDAIQSGQEDAIQSEKEDAIQSGQEAILYDNLEYIGYIMFNDEPFVFINIGSTKPLKTNYQEALLNDLFYTFKVFDTDVDQTIRYLFDNNRWLLNEYQPYSGYMCALNEANQLVNVKIDEDNADLINVESIGDYYYFSFLPIAEESIATQYKRFAIFPNEYVCILDDTQMEEYKENKISYAEDKSIFLKGETLRDKQTKHEFMCVKTPSQFTQY